MKVELLPDRFDIECETPEDWSALVVHCERCGSLYCYGPETRHARKMKAKHGTAADDFLAIAVPCCSRCRPDVIQTIAGQIFLGRFPSTEIAAVGQVCGN